LVTTQHSFTAATLTAHRDVLAALRAMPWFALIVIGILALQTVLELAANQFIPRNSLLGGSIVGVLHYALLTPFFIAVHRFVILGEVTHTYRLQWEDRRFLLFFGWGFTIFAISRLLLIGHVLPRHWMFQSIAFVLAVAACVMFTRVTILFPAIAVDAPGATPRNAFEDTKGHGWYIFFLFLVPFIPSALVMILLSGVAVLLQPVAGRILLLPLAGLAGALWLTMAVVIASRLYQWLGNRVNEPA
jgi:hypothetical protein